MARYETEQKKRLLQFLTEYRDTAFSVEEIAERLKGYGNGAPGKSTVYRLMLRLLEEKKIRRFVGDDGRRFLYQLVGDEHCHEHLHLKCSRCGCLLHLDAGVSRELLDKIRGVSNFFVSQDDTVLFGVCATCGGAR